MWSVLLPWNCFSYDSDSRLKHLSPVPAFFLGIILASLEPSWPGVLPLFEREPFSLEIHIRVFCYFLWYLFFFYHYILSFKFSISPFRIYSKWNFPFFSLPPSIHPKHHSPAFFFPTFNYESSKCAEKLKEQYNEPLHALQIQMWVFLFCFLFCCTIWNEVVICHFTGEHISLPLLKKTISL